MQPKEWIITCDEKSKWIYDITLPKFTIILTAKENNIAKKRNIALDKASAENILFLDSDQFPENNKMLDECIEKSNQGYEILLIPEKFSNNGSYLKRSYHHLWQLYWTNSKQGIPRFFKKNKIGEKRIEIRFNREFPKGRTRINCTTNDKGKWRWTGFQFLNP